MDIKIIIVCICLPSNSKNISSNSSLSITEINMGNKIIGKESVNKYIRRNSNKIIIIKTWIMINMVIMINVQEQAA